MIKGRSFLLVFFCLFIALSIVSVKPTLAQSSSATTGAIIGTVKDQTDAVIVGATVTARNLSTNLTRTIEVNERGIYFLSQLPPGEYEITTKAEGFAVDYSGRIILGLGTTALLDVTLNVLGTGQIIEVIDSSLVNQGKTESSVNIDKKAISGLPINRRDFINFALTTARVTKDPLPSQGVINTSGLAINGQTARGNNLTIDGLSNNDYSSGGALSTFSQEAIQEFQVITDSYSAEMGRALAGAINIVTKSGSNSFSGSLFSTYRSNDISARNAFSEINPEFRQYQFGSTLSGPIKQNKAFFFSSFERLSLKQNNIVTISNQTLDAINRQGFFQNNGSIPFSIGNTSLLLKTDLIVSNKDTLSIRYNKADIYDGALEQFGGLVGDTSGGQLRVSDNSITFNNTYFNSNLINETRLIFTRRTRQTTPISTQPQLRLVAPEGNVRVGQNTALPQMSKFNIFQLVNNTTISYGKHNLKFGVDTLLIRTLPPTTLTQFFSGSYLFTPINFSILTGMSNLPSFTGLEAFDPSLRSPQQKAFLAFLATNPGNLFPGFPRNIPLADLPLPVFYMQGFGSPNISVNATLFSSFLQDEIKLKPNLLIKLGLRYDLTQASSITNNSGNFSPRISFSYSPTNITNLSVHGAYGLFFGAPLGAISAFSQAFEQGLKILIVPLPFSVLPLQLPGKNFPPQMLPKEVLFIPQLSTVGQVDSGFRNNYTQQTSLGINFLPKNNTLLSTEYTFVRGIKLFGLRNLNPIVNPIPNNILDSFINGRSDPSRGNIFSEESAYDSYYHALTLSINQKIQNKINLLASYTYSKAIDNISDFNLLLSEVGNELQVGAERGLALQDIRSRFVFSSVFDIDYSRHVLLKDFELSSIITLESGKPYNLLAGVDLNLSGDSPPGDRPTALGRNVGILPGFASVDLRLTRKIKIKETVLLQTTLEVFNLFNRVNISEIDRTFPPDINGNFVLPKQDKGRFIAPRERFRGAFAPRQLQFGVKLSF